MAHVQRYNAMKNADLLEACKAAAECVVARAGLALFQLSCMLAPLTRAPLSAADWTRPMLKAGRSSAVSTSFSCNTTT